MKTNNNKCIHCGKAIWFSSTSCGSCWKRLRVGNRLGTRSTYAGSKHWNWKGGITTENEKIRRSFVYREWKNAVYKRDKYTCQHCLDTSPLHAHHIKPFATVIEERFNVDNGITLCNYCHKKVHKLRTLYKRSYKDDFYVQII